MSQQAFATHCNLSVRAIAGYESYDREPDLESLIKIKHYSLKFADQCPKAYAAICDRIDERLGFHV